MSRIAVAAVALIIGCGHKDKEAAPAKPDPWAAGSGSAHAGSGSGAAPKIVADPAARAGARALGLRACPIALPVYYAIKKGDKVSHVVGTRHFGIGMARIPAAIATDLRASRVAYFETAPDDQGAVKDPEVDLP